MTTLHGRLNLPEWQPVFDRFCDLPVVSISDAQRRPLPQANFVRTIPHGLPEKRPDVAIKIARAAGVRLKLAAKVDRVDEDYFQTVIRPLLDGSQVEFIGEITEDQKPAFLSGAYALLLPIDWPEPFGLVMIEPMACGTPVIAFNRGSVPEVVADAVTGFIVEDAAGAIAAIDKTADLSRKAVRATFEANFTARQMAADYTAVYRMLGRAQWNGLRVVS